MGQQFVANVTGTPNHAVTWSLQEGSTAGSIDSTGYYTPGITAGTFHVIATSVANPSIKATVTVSVVARTTNMLAIQTGFAQDSAGDFYITTLENKDESLTQEIYKVSASDGILHPFAGNAGNNALGQTGYPGVGGTAFFGLPDSLATMNDGTICVSDSASSSLWKLDATGISTWLAGEQSFKTILDQVWTGFVSSTDGTKQFISNYAGQIFYSSDSGTTWQLQTNYGQQIAIAACNSDASVVYAITGYSIFRSKDFGQTWTQIYTSVSSYAWEIVCSGNDVWALGAGNLFVLYSSNAGDTWVWQSVGFYAYHIAVAENGSLVAVLGSTTDRTWAYCSNKATWNKLTIDNYSYGYVDIQVSPDGNTVYLGAASSTGYTIRKSSNKSTWTNYGLAQTNGNFTKFEIARDGSKAIIYGAFNQTMKVAVTSDINTFTNWSYLDCSNFLRVAVSSHYNFNVYLAGGNVVAFGKGLDRYIYKSSNFTSWTPELVDRYQDAAIGTAYNGGLSYARFNEAKASVQIPSGDIFVLDGHCVRKISGGVQSLLAGGPSLSQSGFTDGLGSAARFKNPFGICYGSDGNLYVADTGNNAIRKVDLAGNVTTLAGNGNLGNLDGIGSAATFQGPKSIAADTNGNLYVLETSGIIGYSVCLSPYVRKVRISDGYTSLFTGQLATEMIGDMFREQGDVSTSKVNLHAASIVRGQTVVPIPCNLFLKNPNYWWNSFIADSYYNWTSIPYTLNGNTWEGGNPVAPIKHCQDSGIYANMPFYQISTVPYVVNYLNVPKGYSYLVAHSVAVDGTPAQAYFVNPVAICYGIDGNLYVLDSWLQSSDSTYSKGKIRRIDLNGNVTSIALN
jgi:sugar lactone lactonase YvrE